MYAYKPYSLAPPQLVPQGIDLTIPWQIQLISQQESKTYVDQGWTVVNELTDVQPVILQKSAEVITQYEKNDKDLKLARARVDVVDGLGSLYCRVPGEFGSDAGRYVGGGEAILDSFDWDDYAKVYVEDKDRVLAYVYGMELAGRPLTDEEMQFGSEFSMYPVVKSYTDDEAPAENQGWYFYPESMGNRPACGILEVEPIGGYGFLPAGFYLRVDVIRPNVSGGSARINIFWGKKE